MLPLSDAVPYPGSVDALADALRSDHVIVQQTRGSGDAAGADDRISRVVAQLPFDAYVAVVDAPRDVDAGTGASDYLATALSRRIGTPGVYVVSADSRPIQIRVVGTDWDETQLSLQVFDDSEAVEDAAGHATLVPTVSAEAAVQTALAAPPRSAGGPPTTVSLSDAVVADLAAREVALTPYSGPGLEEVEEPWSPGKRAMVGTVVGAGLLAVLLQTIWGWPGWRGGRRPPGGRDTAATSKRSVAPPPPELESERANASHELTLLAEALVSASPGPRTEQALLAREAAEPLVESDRVVDVVGAFALARGGRDQLRGRPSHPCFFDPRHRRATRTAEWLWGDGEVEVPVCAACDDVLGAGGQPAALVVRSRLGRVRPYYEGDSVWARTGFGALTDDVGELARRVADDARSSR